MTYTGEKRDFWLRVLKDVFFGFGILTLLASVVLSIDIWIIFINRTSPFKIITSGAILLLGLLCFIISLSMYILLKKKGKFYDL